MSRDNVGAHLPSGICHHSDRFLARLVQEVEELADGTVRHPELATESIERK